MWQLRRRQYGPTKPGTLLKRPTQAMTGACVSARFHLPRGASHSAGIFPGRQKPWELALDSGSPGREPHMRPQGIVHEDRKLLRFQGSLRMDGQYF